MGARSINCSSAAPERGTLRAPRVKSGMPAAIMPMSDAPDDDAALMVRVASGDTAAFTALVLRLHKRSLGLATRILDDRAEAEDVVQTSFARLWSEAKRFDATRGSVGGWFRRMLVNLCLDRRRSIKLVRSRMPATLDDAYDVADSAPGPLASAEANALAKRVDAAMARLNARQRAAIALFHGEGATMAEIADALETTPKAVEGLLARARIELKALLASDAPESNL